MSMPVGRFGGVATAMVTPFDDTGALDLDGAATLARWLADNGSDALIVAGSTGEATALSDDEKIDLWRCVAEAVTVPVVAGAGTADTRHSIELTRAASAAGAAGILAVTPYYSRPAQAGLEAHFRAVAAATDLPVVLYDIPVRTGRRIAAEVILRLAAEVPNIVAVKDATGDPAGAARLVADAPAGFELYSGDDGLTLPLLAVGACGVISVASHWCGRAMRAVVDAFMSGDVDGARRINATLLASFRYESGDAAPNPVPTKAMMRVLGLPAGQCRLPLGGAPPGLEEEARSLLAALGERAPAGVGAARHGG